MSENTKILKFTMLVKDINKAIQVSEISKVDIGVRVSTLSNFFNMESNKNTKLSTVKSPLKLFVDSKKANEYSNIILNNAKFKLDEWAEYTSGRTLGDLKENTLVTKKLIKILKKSTNKRETLNFIFWLLFISTVDNTDYDEKISTIADLSYMIGLSDEVIQDLTNVVKVVLGDEDSKMKINTEEVRENFWRIIKPM